MTYYYNPARPDDPTDPNSPTAPDLVAIAPPELSPGIPIEGYVPCEYNTETQTITFPNGDNLPWPPTPPPPAEWSQWQFTSRGDFRLVFGAVMAMDPFSATVLSGLITNTPSTNLDSLTTIWNEAMSLVDTGAIAVPLAAIDASAVTHHIPLRIGAGGVMTVVT